MADSESFFTSPFSFGIDVPRSDYVPRAADAAADVVNQLQEEDDHIALANWVIDVYGVKVDVDSSYVKLLQDLPGTIGGSTRFAKHLINRGNCTHYPAEGSAMNHSTNSKKARVTGGAAPRNIPAIVEAAGGRVIGEMRGSRFQVACAKGHVCQLLPVDIHEWCALCRCLDVLSHAETGSIKYTALTSLFGSDMCLFRIKCPRSHEFVTTIGDASAGCPSCRVEQTIKDSTRLKMTVLSAYEHKRSILRTYCHNCKMIFYTSEKSAIDGEVLSCDSQHICRANVEKQLVAVRHILELLFRSRFDDIMSDEKVYFNAFSVKFRLACIFEGDPVTSKYIVPARRWCTSAGVKLLILPKKVADTREVTIEIIRQLAVVELVSISHDDIVEELADFLLGIHASMSRQHRPLYVTF